MAAEYDNLTAANREAWDSKAKEYDAKPWQKKLASQVAEALNSHANWLGANWASSSNKECRLLDYACGTGSVTRALSTHITHATGLDTSPAMLSQYTSLLSSSHPSLSLQTSIADLCSPDPQSSISSPEFYDFDVAGVALGFHHFGDPKGCVRNLAQRLKPGGVLFIVDWLPNTIAPDEHIGHAHAHSDDHSHSHHHGTQQQQQQQEQEQEQETEETEEWKKMKKTIKTNGFTEQDMKDIFKEAGFEDFGFVVLDDEGKFLLEMNGKRVEKTGFIAKGRRVV